MIGQMLARQRSPPSLLINPGRVKPEGDACWHDDARYWTLFKVGRIENNTFAAFELFVPDKSNHPSIFLMLTIWFGRKYRFSA